MADLGNTAVISPTDASNGTGTMPSWLGSAAPSTLDDAGRALQGAVAREWENRSYPTATGTSPAYVVTYTVAPAAYRSGQTYTFTAHSAATGTDTLNANTLGAKAIKKVVAGTKTATAANDFYAGDKISCVYDGTDMVWTNWQGASSSAASETVAGIVELATDAETITGTDTARAITPANLTAKLASAAATAYSPGAIYGLVMSNAADTANDITVAAGKARDEADTGNLVLAASITKQIDAAWSVGTNAGGLNTGTVANDTWYEVHLIKRVDTGVVDVMFTTTANRATLPTSYTLQRRIGWVRFGTATFLQFTQVGDHFTWTTQINDVSASTTATAAAVTLTVPPSSLARFRASLVSSTSGVAGDDTTIVFSEIVEGNVSPSPTTGIASLSAIEPIAGMSTTAAGHFELRVSSTSTIEHDSNLAGGTFDISTFGFIDSRVRLGP